MESPNELTILNVPALVNSAQQLRIVLEINRDALADELHPQVTGLSTLELAAKQLQVTDEASNQEAIRIMTDAQQREKALNAIWGRYKTPLNAARAVVLDMEKRTAGVAEAIKKMASEKSGRFLLAQKKAKEEMERKLARMVEQEQAKLNEQAEDLMLSGDVSAAQGKLAEANMMVAPTLPSMDAKPSGARITPKYKGSCTDLMSVIKAIAAGRTPLVYEVNPGDTRPLLVMDPVVLNSIVSRQGAGTHIPGVTVQEVINVAPSRR